MQSHNDKNDESEIKKEAFATTITTQPIFKNQNKVQGLKGVPEILSTAIRARTELFDLPSGILLDKTNQALHEFFKPQIKEAHITQLLGPLLEHVIKGEQKEAEAILHNHPDLIADLLLRKGIVTDYSGRKIEGTALQLALGAEDFGIQKDEEGMVEMLMRYLKKLPEGEVKITEQYTAQFPEDKEYEEQAAKNNAEDIKALEDVIAAIDAKPDDCEKELQTFRDYLAPKKEAITRGKHFNANLLLKAYELYDSNYERFGNNWNRHPKNILCWRKVIGYIQRFLPACYAQAFAQGLYYVMEGKEKIGRSLEFRNDRSFYFFPINSALRSGLGFDFAAHWGDAAEVRWGGSDGRLFQDYVEQKTPALRGLLCGRGNAAVLIRVGVS